MSSDYETRAREDRLLTFVYSFTIAYLLKYARESFAGSSLRVLFKYEYRVYTQSQMHLGCERTPEKNAY